MDQITKLSVNINKIDTLRNSRNGNNPDVVKAAIDARVFGADGITVHPRPDERQAIVLPFGQASAGIAKQLLNNKASIKFNVRDIFYTQNPKEIQNFQDVQSSLKITRDTRVFNVAFVYRFGASIKSKPASTLLTDEQQRVKIN